MTYQPADDPRYYGDEPDDDGRELDLDEVRAAIEHDGPPTRAQLERLLGREVSDAEWHTVQDLCPAPALCVDCRAVEYVAVTADWLEAQGWQTWRGGARCPVCVARRDDDGRATRRCKPQPIPVVSWKAPPPPPPSDDVHTVRPARGGL